MGSMQCYRVGCENACCDLYNERFGYICFECFEQLVAIGSLDVAAFMADDKEVKINREVFESLFPKTTY